MAYYLFKIGTEWNVVGQPGSWLLESGVDGGEPLQHYDESQKMHEY